MKRYFLIIWLVILSFMAGFNFYHNMNDTIKSQQIIEGDVTIKEELKQLKDRVDELSAEKGR